MKNKKSIYLDNKITNIEDLMNQLQSNDIYIRDNEYTSDNEYIKCLCNRFLKFSEYFTEIVNYFTSTDFYKTIKSDIKNDKLKYTEMADIDVILINCFLELKGWSYFLDKLPRLILGSKKTFFNIPRKKKWKFYESYGPMLSRMLLFDIHGAVERLVMSFYFVKNSSMTLFDIKKHIEDKRRRNRKDWTKITTDNITFEEFCMNIEHVMRHYSVCGKTNEEDVPLWFINRYRNNSLAFYNDNNLYFEKVS